ncbi:hypothetical protein GOV11_03785 [Candidatus Woesearchaeota archaeon]|nr:hypothetical protein [Candidatus Woesearchaeota archaeon]
MTLPQEEQFHFGDGTTVSSLDGLRDYLEHISYEEFYFHVNAEKNDFANWIRHVLKESNLADNLDKVSSIVETVEIINDYLNPRPPKSSHDDIQSKIEKKEGIDLKEVPSTQPEEAPKEEEKIEKPSVPAEPLDFTELEKQLEKDTEAAEQPKEEKPEEAPKLPEEMKPEEAPAEAPKEKHKDEYVLTAREKKQLIVKDFIIGMFFGLIIGLLLGRMLPV